MWKYKLQYGDVSIDEEKLKMYVSKMARQHMMGAAREFVRVAMGIIPVWTGEAMGTLQPLASQLHISIPKSPDPQAPYNGFSIGASRADYFDPPIKETSPFIFEFKIGSDIPHVEINEQYDVSKWGITLKNPTPWRAFEQAGMAARVYLQAAYKVKFPKYMDVAIINHKVGMA